MCAWFGCVFAGDWHCIKVAPRVGRSASKCNWATESKNDPQGEIFKIWFSSSGDRNERLPDLCFLICSFSQVVFIP